MVRFGLEESLKLCLGVCTWFLNELYLGQDRVVHILRRAVTGGEKGQATMSCIWGSNVIHGFQADWQTKVSLCTKEEVFGLKGRSIFHDGRAEAGI